MAKSVKARLEAFQKKSMMHHGPRCGISRLPKHLIQAVDGERGKGSPQRLLSEFLKSEGYQIGAACIGRHWRLECCCFRVTK